MLLFASIVGLDQVLDLSKLNNEFPPSREKLVLAFYYPWYGTPEVSGQWRHYDKVDLKNKDIEGWSHFPLYGVYDSSDPSVVERHFSQMKSSGIDGVVSSWWGIGTFEDRVVPLLLKKASKFGLKVSLYYEVVNGRDKYSSVLKDFKYIVQKYGEHPSYLKVNGKPVLFVYSRVMGSVSPMVLKKAANEAGVFLVVDQISPFSALIFDGIHTYGAPGIFFYSRNLKEIKQRAFDYASNLVKTAGPSLAVMSITPGYDDHEVPGRTTPFLDRYNGKLYEYQWRAALKYNPDWVVILTWNEWHEGTEIEPSVEFGDKYLKLTRKFSAKFHKKPVRKASRKLLADKLLLKDQEKAVFEELVAGKKILSFAGIGYFSMICGLNGAKVYCADWSDLASVEPGEYDVVVYEDGERYESAYVDVLKEISFKSYLVASANLPFPFYYNEAGKPSPVTFELGLPISGSGANDRADYLGSVRGFETPPQEGLYFEVNPKYLVGYPRKVPFPRKGDKRFRPLVKPPADEARSISLVVLRSPEGKYMGDACSVIRWKDGRKVAYIWFRLWDVFKPADLVKSVILAMEDLEKSE